MRPRRIAAENLEREAAINRELFASMRPRRIAAENGRDFTSRIERYLASMRPRRIAAENSLGGNPHCRPLGGR